MSLATILGALIDPFIVLPAILVGWFVATRFVRSIILAVLAVAVSFLIVVNLDAAGVILPSEKPELIAWGSVGRWIVAVAIAEMAGFLRSRLQPRLGSKGNPIIGCRAPQGCRWQIVGKWPLDRRWDTLPGMDQAIPVGPSRQVAPETTQTVHGNADTQVPDER